MAGEENQSTDKDYNDKQPTLSILLIASISVSPNLFAGKGGGTDVSLIAVIGAAIDLGTGASVVGANAAADPDLLKTKNLFNE